MGNTTDYDQLRDGDPKRRQYVRFDPTLNVGTIAEILVILGGMVLAWGTLKSDQQTQRVELDSLKSAAVAEKQLTKEALAEIKGDVKEVQRSLNQALRTLDVIDARQQPTKEKP